MIYDLLGLQFVRKTVISVSTCLINKIIDLPKGLTRRFFSFSYQPWHVIMMNNGGPLGGKG